MSSSIDTMSNDIPEKFKRVIHGLLSHEYSVTNDVYLEMLLSHLSGKEGEDYSEILADPTLSDWIEKSVNQITSDHPQNVRVFAFTIQLTALFIESKEKFDALNSKNVLTSLLNTINTAPRLQNPSVKLALIILFQAAVKHDAGIAWARENRCWSVALEYITENQTVYVVRRALDFLTDFLFRIVHDEPLCNEIVGAIMKPLNDNVYKDEEVGRIFVDSSDLQRKTTPAVNIVCSVLKRYIQQNEPSGLVNMIINTHKGSLDLWKLTDMTVDPLFFDKIMASHVYINFARLVDTFMAQQPQPDKLTIEACCGSSIDYNEFGLNFLNAIKYCVLKNHHLSVLHLCKLYYEQWKALGDRVPDEIVLGNQLTRFENQIVLFLLMPILIVMKKSNTIFTEVTNEYITKLFNISAEHTLRICYSFRDSMLKDMSKVPELASKAIQVTLSMTNVLQRDCAVIVFQALMHIVKGFAIVVREGDTSELEQHPNLLTAVLTGLYAIVKRFRITWKESYESISLLNFMLYLLQHTSLAPTLAVHTLKLLQLSIDHFLAPNLALLMDTMEGSEMQNLGPVILKRLHDANWEVRDSSLEVLATTASIAKLKFPAFQKHILSHGLCPIVVDMAKHDGELFVRASALNCLSQMVNVQLFWENCLSSCDLIPYLFEVLQNESEGVVRKEAVGLLTSIYDSHTIPTALHNSVYSTLAFSAVNDLHWEVRTKALAFWEVIIRQRIQHQGVIDGTFPTVTFSKEKKKIVTLTPTEITSRLTKILDELSSCGCLGILLACIETDADLSVVKAAVPVIKMLVDFLDKYKYWHEVRDQRPNECQPSAKNGSTDVVEDATRVTEPTAANSDDIIQSIISSQDINLLAESYENQLNVMASDQATGLDAMYCKTFADVTAYVFVQTIKSNDLNEIIRVRSEWMEQTESFTSLLNDMLYSLKVDDVNDIDCY